MHGREGGQRTKVRVTILIPSSLNGRNRSVPFNIDKSRSRSKHIIQDKFNHQKNKKSQGLMSTLVEEDFSCCTFPPLHVNILTLTLSSCVLLILYYWRVLSCAYVIVVISEMTSIFKKLDSLSAATSWQSQVEVTCLERTVTVSLGPNSSSLLVLPLWSVQSRLSPTLGKSQSGKIFQVQNLGKLSILRGAPRGAWWLSRLGLWLLVLA